jgi:FkbM family methyltransferase
MRNISAFVGKHVFWSLTGFTRLLASQPAWALRLLMVRLKYFVTRRFTGQMITPDNFLIESANELISYWSFFVERECWDEGWGKELLKATHPLILDVGANAGLFSHWVWLQQPGARFVVFEPLPKMASKIRAWIGRTGADAQLQEKAVSNQPGTATFYSSSDDDTTASLRPEGAKTREAQVPVVSLDSALLDQEVFLVKIDVEGAECEVLAGAVKTLGRTRFLLVEAHTTEARSKIHHQLGAAWQSKQVGTSDYLFWRT